MYLHGTGEDGVLFGYVRAFIPELKVRESEIYKAAYCTLCRELGRSYGVFSRLTLSYDFAFLALLRLSLAEQCTGFEQKRCAFNPMKKCKYCKNTGDLFEPVTAAAMIMLYYKLRDNIADSKGVKRFGYRLLMPIYSRPHKKAAARFPELEQRAAAYIAAQNTLEAAGETSADRAAEPTASMLSYIFELCGDHDSEKRVLSRMGYCAGRWIYLLDAAADLEKDAKSGNYNVLLSRGGDMAALRQEIEPSLNLCVGEAAKAAELLDFHRYGDIIRNVLYLGLPNMQEKILVGEDKKTTDKSKETMA